jgi:hypothetical protein
MPSPALSIAIIKRARKLLRCGKLTHRDFAIIDALVWCCRSPTSGRISISYAALARLCHCARSTVALAVSKLEALGILSRVRRFALVQWHQCGLQARRLANAYVVHCKSDRASANYSDSIYITVPAVPGYAIEAAKEALEARRRVITARLASNTT